MAMPEQPHQYQSAFLKLISERGQLHDCTDAAALDARMQEHVVTGYIGFDCTAPSLHIGNLTQIMTLRRLQQSGHRPIVVVGGGTTKVGDPSGKEELRSLLSDEQIDANKQSILKTFERFLNFGDGPTDAIMVDNAEWLDRLEYIPFLREVGSRFSVNRMLTMDSVKLRLERDQPLSFLEFNYMILQAYDFVELHKRYGCTLQCGGSDQWGNIVSGIDLGRRLVEAELFGVTSPLLTTASGAKMGKTAKGAVWLNADMLSPYEYWQFWRNTEDADVGRFLRLFTELPEDEIARLENLSGAELNDAKKLLATETTRMLHGKAAADDAAEAARRTFEEGASSENLPVSTIGRGADNEWSEGRTNTAILFATGFVSSNSEARRKILEGAVKINDQKVDNPMGVQKWTDVDPATGAFKVQLGKKKVGLVKPEA